jgi:hypothetical protein
MDRKYTRANQGTPTLAWNAATSLSEALMATAMELSVEIMGANQVQNADGCHVKSQEQPDVLLRAGVSRRSDLFSLPANCPASLRI